MARILNVEKMDVGYVFQQAITEEMQKQNPKVEGMRVTQDKNELLNWFCEVVGIDLKVGGPIMTPAEEERKNLFAADSDISEYDRELARIVNDNDRGTVQARLDKHVEAGSLVEYNNRNGIKKLVQLLRKADDAAKAGQTVDADGAAVDNAQVEEAENPPVGSDQVSQPATGSTAQNSDAGVQYTAQDVGAALQEVAQANGPKAAMSVLTDLGANKLSELPPDKYAQAIALAEQRKAAQ
jgi:hypothetical protein